MGPWPETGASDSPGIRPLGTLRYIHTHTFFFLGGFKPYLEWSSGSVPVLSLFVYFFFSQDYFLFFPCCVESGPDTGSGIVPKLERKKKKKEKTLFPIVS